MRTIFLSYLLVSSISIHAQGEKISFRHLSVQDGLSQNWVKTIHQDHEGFLWFGTNDGLNRYDGYQFKTYKNGTNRANSLLNNNVQVIYEDSKDRLWVGVQRGLNLYIRNRDHFVPIASTHGHCIEDILELKDGNLLVAVPGGLYLLNTETFSFTELFYDTYIHVILQDHKNRIWLGTNKGLLLYDLHTNTYKSFIIDPSARDGKSKNEIHCLFEDSKGRLWMGNNHLELYQVRYADKDTPPDFIRHNIDPPTSKQSSRGAILAITEDSRGRLWIGTGTNGLAILEPGSGNHPTKVTHSVHDPTDFDGLKHNSIQAIYADNQNTIWIGTYGGGINYYNELLNKFHHVEHSPNESSINSNHVNVLYDDGDLLWIGTEGGLNRYDKRTGKYKLYSYRHDDPASIGANAIYSIFRDSKNNLWVGTWAGGLNLLNEEEGTFERFQNDLQKPTSISNNNVFTIQEDSRGNLWVGTMGGGLNRFHYETRTFEKHQEIYEQNSLSNNWVRDILESSYGELWISTATAVDIYTPSSGRFVSFRHDSTDQGSISYDGAVVLFEDSKRNIWIGTEGGLNIYNREDSSFTYYTEKDGLPNNTIQGIVEDHHGHLWLSTNKGISKFINGTYHPDNPHFENYFSGDGLQGDEFNRRTYCQDDHGVIYFGGTNGFNYFHPDSIETNAIPPVVAFTSFQVFNKPVEVGTEDSPLQKSITKASSITLQPHQSVFSIGFAALSYISTEENQYAYRLKGFETDWNHVGTKTSATYTNLDPGLYTFQVKAANNDGVWSNEIKSIDIEILPHWWQSWWARCIYLLLFFILLYLIRKYTIISVNVKNQLWKEHLEKEKSEELSELKLQFFTNISHELRTPLTLISGPLNRLLKKGKSSTELILMHRNVDRLRNLVDQILDFQKLENNQIKLNLQQEDILATIKGVAHLFGDFARERNVRLTFSSEFTQLNVQFDKDKLEKILSNLLSNAIKHTPENGSVKVEVNSSSSSQWLEITVQDTGVGIAANELSRIFDRFYTVSNNQNNNNIGTGIGLHLAKRLIELHKGTIEVKSELGIGSEFKVKLPLANVNYANDITPHKIPCQPTTNPKILSICDAGSECVYSELPKQEMDRSTTTLNPEVREQTETILIIDDNQEMCSYLAYILTEDYKVITSTDAAEGLSLAAQHQPDLIVSDIMMPNMDGFSFCQRLKEDQRTVHMPLIFLTAKTSETDHLIGYNAGADDYLYKPFNEELLKSRIRNLIAQRKSLKKLYQDDDDIRPEVVNESDRAFINKVLAIIKENYRDSAFNVNQIIQEMAMSRSAFYKKLKSASPTPINDLIKGYRLKKAEELLLKTSLPITEVAFRSGFSNPTYFSTVFKDQFNVSPNSYKEKSTVTT